MDEYLRSEETSHNLEIIKQSSIFTEGGFKKLVEENNGYLCLCCLLL